jgi:hypothetical protein
MSYELGLRFDPAIEQRDFLKYFADRRNFTVSGTQIAYQNPDTGVGFFIRFQPSKGFLSRKSIGAANFEINYFRPSFFGVEAQIELSALVARFAPRIEDSQMKGMGEGPYSAAGFLSGWNFGNEFGVRAITSGHPDQKVQTMPADKLRAAWTWNYRKPEWNAQAGEQQFVPTIMPVAVGDVPSLVAVWALGMPVILPKVDYVLVGRDDAGVKRYGLAPWSEVLAQLRRAGINVEGDPLDIKYATTPVSIARWIAEIPEVDLKTLPRLSFPEIIDTELVEAATRPQSQPNSPT